MRYYHFYAEKSGSYPEGSDTQNRKDNVVVIRGKER